MKTKVKELDRVRIALVTKSCSNVWDRNCRIVHHSNSAKAVQGGLKQERVVFFKKNEIMPS